MLNRKMIFLAGVLVLSGAGIAQATELGARSILFDNAANQRALTEQAQYRAYRQQYRLPRQQVASTRAGVGNSSHG